MSQIKEIPFSAPVAELFIEKVLKPTLAQMSKDAGRSICLHLQVVRGQDAEVELGAVEVGDGGARIRGIAHLRFRDGFRRVMAQADVVFDRDTAIADCSGFQLSGEILPDLVSAKRTGWTVRYGVWDFMGWF